MSFVDSRVIRAHMAKKDARLNRQAKLRACTQGESRTKINGAVVDVEASLTAPDRNGQTLREERHNVTAIPHSNPQEPVRTGNTVSTRAVR